jgi:hypothetical protein
MESETEQVSLKATHTHCIRICGSQKVRPSHANRIIDAKFEIFTAVKIQVEVFLSFDDL